MKYGAAPSLALTSLLMPRYYRGIRPMLCLNKRGFQKRFEVVAKYRTLPFIIRKRYHSQKFKLRHYPGAIRVAINAEIAYDKVVISCFQKASR